MEIAMGRSFDAVVAGHLCIDVYPEFLSASGGSGAEAVLETFVPGKLVEVGPLTLCTGGCVPNTGLALLKLGIKAVLMGKVGTDAFGPVLRTLLAERGADARLVVVDGQTTSYTVGLALPGADRIFLHHPGPNDTFCADDVDYDLVAQARLFHLGYPPLMRGMYQDGGRELARILSRVRELGTLTSMDMALPDPASPAGKADWPGILARSLPFVDVFLPSAEETLYMLDRPGFDRRMKQARAGSILDGLSGEDLAKLTDKLLACGCKVAAIKCGHRGIYVRTAEFANPFAPPAAAASWAGRELWEPVFKVEHFASAAGAGDCTIAGFLASLLRGLPLEDSLRYATAVGAENVEAMDPSSGVHSWDEISARIDAGWAKDGLDAAGAGWSFDRRRQAWRGPHDKEKSS